MNLIDKLNNLSSELFGNHPYVDFGGCCVVAAAVAPRLAEHVPTRIVSCNGLWNGNKSKNIEEIRNTLKKHTLAEWYDNGVEFHHVLVEFEYENKWYTFDSTDGVVLMDQYWEGESAVRHDGEFTVAEARRFADTPEWNPRFDRDEIPVVRGRITKFFNRLAN